MSLQQPSDDLDSAVFDVILPPHVVTVSPARTPHFGFRWLAITAVVCVSVGICIGSWLQQRLTRNSNSHLLTSSNAHEDPVSQPEDSPARMSLHEIAAAPLHGFKAQIIDLGFVLLDGDKPFHSYRVVRSRRQQGEHMLPIRETFVLPAPEI